MQSFSEIRCNKGGSWPNSQIKDREPDPAGGRGGGLEVGSICGRSCGGEKNGPLLVTTTLSKPLGKGGGVVGRTKALPLAQGPSSPLSL